ncbi:hypothetical protein BsIDN1_59910 [Bacillus safensis]|uniref:Sugar-binding domain-containing protein n=1 Tax=Bacillus safensis TaxID=561879 RepID=A0A5S9MH16_BACIA|nr:hypothetical protein BsIDN1_59910 [Bacillus safensis]
MEAVAEMMTPDAKNRDMMFVPARGGLGENVKNQANTICAHMAEKKLPVLTNCCLFQGSCQKVLTLPLLKSRPSKKCFKRLNRPRCLFMVLVKQKTMAMRRNTPAEDLKRLMSMTQ